MAVQGAVTGYEGWIVNFASVALGVLLGHQLSLRRERKLERERTRDDRQRLRESLQTELSEIETNIEYWDASDEVVPDMEFPTASYESGIANGTFGLLDNDLQRELTGIYESVDRVMARQERLREFQIRNGLDSSDKELLSRLSDFRNEIDELESLLADGLGTLGEGR